MKRISLIMIALVTVVTSAMAQGANNIKLNEVMTVNTSGLQDEYGTHPQWIEIVNTAYSTYNVRGMYITTDRSVLNKKLSVPERIKRMSIIPSGYAQTVLSAQQHIVLYLNSSPAKGVQHITAKADTASQTWIALYDGNAVDLIDSVTVPVLKANTSYARYKDGAAKWVIKTPEAVTPGIDNFIQVTESKIDKLKRDDPHGIGITVLCMGIVFLCLALLYIFFLIFGWIADRRAKLANTQPIKPVVITAKKINKVRHATSNILQDGIETKGRDKEIYIAVISMALKQYLENVHDVESGIISIKPKQTRWGEHNNFNNFVSKGK